MKSSKHEVYLAVFLSILLFGCVSTPKEPVEIFGSNLDEVEQYISTKYELIFETDFTEDDKKIGLAMNGTLDRKLNNVIFEGTEPHSILFVFNALRFGKAAYLRYKPISGKWYSISVESGEFEKESFRGLSLMRSEGSSYSVYASKGLKLFSEKNWTRRQFNYRNTEYLILFDIDFDGKTTIRMFNDKGQYNTFISTDILTDVNIALLFKVEKGLSEVIRYKEFEY